MKLQKATYFALYAVLELAADPARQLSAVEIAEKYGISAHHLAKVLRVLGRAGVVDSTRGVGGGYRFAGNAKRLTLLDAIRLFEPLGNERSKSGEQPPNNAAGRALKLVLDETDEHAAATFRSITISTMLKIMAQRLASEPTKETRRPRARQDRRGSASRAGGNG
ncbi:MAG TPA: Rrf2 family transcriptional regulator [Alphaproteobacteria bacterium]|nr:Rrf2 family transcriptional regulator [Alphaproteobacteria bacterium]